MASSTSTKPVRKPAPKPVPKGNKANPGAKPVRTDQASVRPCTGIGGSAQELKKYFAAYCQEKADIARERIRSIHSEIGPAKKELDAVYALFETWTEDKAFAERPRAEEVMNASAKLASRLQAYSSALAECYGCLSLIEDAESVDDVNVLRDRYEEPVSDASAEKMRCQQRKYVSKACNYAEQAALAQMKAAKAAAESEAAAEADAATDNTPQEQNV